MDPEDGTDEGGADEGASSGGAPATAGNPANPGDPQARRDAIVAKIRAAAAARPAAVSGQAADNSDEDGEDGDESDGEGDEDDKAAPKKGAPAGRDEIGQAAARIAELAGQVTSLTERLTAAEAKGPAADKYAALLDRVKTNPAVLFDEIPDLSLEKLSEAYLKRQDDPGFDDRLKTNQRISELETKLAEKEKGEQTAAQQRETERVEAEGKASIKTIVEADKARWPRSTRHEKNTAEAIDRAVATAKTDAQAFMKKNGRHPSEKEATAIVSAALDKAEAHFADLATRLGVPDITPAPRRTIAAAPAGGAVRDGVPPPKKLTREQIVERVRRAQPKA